MIRIKWDFINILFRIISNFHTSNPAHKERLHYYFNTATFQSGILQILIKRDRAEYLTTASRFRYIVYDNRTQHKTPRKSTLTQSVMGLTRTRRMPVSNLGQDKNYHDWHVQWVRSIPPRNDLYGYACRLTTGIRSEIWVVRRFRRCVNVRVYLHKPRYHRLIHTWSIYSLLLLGYKPVLHVTVLNTVGQF